MQITFVVSKLKEKTYISEEYIFNKPYRVTTQKLQKNTENDAHQFAAIKM